MSLCYIVDGYNVMRRLGRFEQGRLQDQRESFIVFLRAHRPVGSARNRLIIVFDGAQELFGMSSITHKDIVFSKGESADDAIKKMVAASSRRADIVVVTDDRDLSLSVRAMGARVSGVKDFLLKSDSVKKRSQESEDESLDPLERQRINQEMENIWLKKKSS